jgi:hypothetical protein
MHLLVQLPPGTPGINGPSDHVLHVFACRWMDSCDNIYNKPGHDAVVWTPIGELSEGLTPFPWRGEDDVLPDGLTKRLTPVQPAGLGQVRARCVAAEIWIKGYAEYEDRVTEDTEDALYDSDLFWALTDEEASPHDFDGRYHTKFGGAPYWGGDGPMGTDPDMRQVLQVGGHIFLNDPPEPGLEPYDHFSDTGHPLAPMRMGKSIEDDAVYVEFDASPWEGGGCHVMARKDGTFALIERR